MNTFEPIQRDPESTDYNDEIDDSVNSQQFKYDSSNILCEHYSATVELSGGGYQIETEEEFIDSR